MLVVLNNYLYKDYEFTIEVNPETIDEEKIKLFKKYGINRVSIGVESFNGDMLKILNRNHNNEDVINVTKALLKNKYYVTKLATTGGVISSGNTTLLLGVENDQVDKVKDIVSNFSKTRKKKISTDETNDLNVFSFLPTSVNVSGATIFVLNIDESYKL